jgi:hypothetical protein
MYKQASKLKLRFLTTKGTMSVEQLWDLSLSDLDSLAVSLEEAYKNSKGKSFLTKKTEKDKTIKLQFDIVLDVLQTKVEDNEAAQIAENNKAKLHKALEIRHKVQSVAEEEKIANMSEKEFEKYIADLK